METYNNYKLIEDSSGKKGYYKNSNQVNKNLAIFVHGFTGHYASTWGKFPQLLINDPSLNNYDFLFWGYSSHLIANTENNLLDSLKQLSLQILNKQKTNQRIEVLSQGLQTELKYLDDYDNITLIGHSLGGLIIRSFIIHNLINRKKESLEKIRQIILFGTPNEGINTANNKLLSLLNNQISDLGPYNEFIKDLREEWVERVFKNHDLKFSTLMVAGEDDFFVPFEQVTRYFRDSRELTRGNHESMVKPESIEDLSYKIVSTNLLKASINHDQHNQIQSMQKNVDIVDLSNSLLNKIRKMIADRGLDDQSWSKAISSQYFLVKTARLLNITDKADYHNLLDLFLKSFYMKVDNSIVLSKDKILVTPTELIKIKNYMIKEDEIDNYYAKHSKNSAQNIDIDLLHDNYLYGLIAQISNATEFPNSLTLKMIRNLSISKLIYSNGKKPTDDHGGWYPQRIPWVTARILISLKNSGYEDRHDKGKIEEIINQASDYLIRDIYESSYWRSGVGRMVSDWESTSICLEAFDQCEKIKKNEDKILNVIKYCLEMEDEWLTCTSFLTEEDANSTLASVTLLCNLLIIIHKNFIDQYKINYLKYLEYLLKVLINIEESAELTVRQYCTIPQIAFYITRLIRVISK